MAINSICKTNVITITKDASIKEAANLMRQQHIGCIVVSEKLNGKRKPVGMITDRDIALAIGTSSKPQDLKVKDCMQDQLITVKESEGIFKTIVKMREQGVKRLPVVDENDALFGLTSADDLLSFMAEEINNLTKITENQIRKEEGLRISEQQKQIEV